MISSRHASDSCPKGYSVLYLNYVSTFFIPAPITEICCNGARYSLYRYSSLPQFVLLELNAEAVMWCHYDHNNDEGCMLCRLTTYTKRVQVHLDSTRQYISSAAALGDVILTIDTLTCKKASLFFWIIMSFHRIWSTTWGSHHIMIRTAPREIKVNFHHWRWCNL